MSDLLRPGSDVSSVLGDAWVVATMARLEAAWSQALVTHGVAPDTALVSAADVAAAAPEPGELAAEVGAGNPVVGFVATCRERLGGDRGRWLHRGLTSQDVVDTALVLAGVAARERILAAGVRQIDAGLRHLDALRDVPAVARTLTQPAVPTTAAVQEADRLAGVLDGLERLRDWRPPAQSGGAAGTSAALVELAGDAETALAVQADWAAALDLEAVAAWHVRRAPLTTLADACVQCGDAWGRLANDVLAGARPEIAEVSEGASGGSSTMPHKQNPVRATLLRAASLRLPHQGAALHTAASAAHEARSAGPWHAEWPVLRELLRDAVGAAELAADLLEGLRHDRERLASGAVDPDLLGEQRVMADLAGRAPAPRYEGLAAHLSEQVARRAREVRATIASRPVRGGGAA